MLFILQTCSVFWVCLSLPLSNICNSNGLYGYTGYYWVPILSFILETIQWRHGVARNWSGWIYWILLGLYWRQYNGDTVYLGTGLAGYTGYYGRQLALLKESQAGAITRFMYIFFIKIRF